jgi:PBSX family phage portal protein
MAIKVAEKKPETSLAKVDPKEIQSKATFVQKVIGSDTYTVMTASSFLPEDEFTNLYFTVKDPTKVFLQPPFDPKYLKHLPLQNNILNQCIEAMEVNIDGTGFEFVPLEDGKEVDKAEERRLKAFMDEPYPGVSLITMRSELRRDLEAIGWGFLEVLRNAAGELVGLRNIPAQTIRFIRLDQPIQVTKKLMRDGKEVEMTYWARERRFAQTLGNTMYRYFVEYGATRHVRGQGSGIGIGMPIDPQKQQAKGAPAGGVMGVGGEWESKDNPIDPKDRGSELLVFRVHSDVETPYGVPRWINQMPSVIGSRKAEEQNLEFFDSGGMPPAIIFIEGGTLAKDTADQLRMYLSGQMKARNRAVVVEAQSSSGSLDSTGQVRTKVERFGAETSKDAMYSNYDDKTEDHVRTGFRLPPLFVGKAADYNFATATTSYMVAEAQVFGPERLEFDEMWNRTIMKELKATTCKFKSKPITLKDVASQLEGLKTALPVAKKAEWIEDMNKVTGLSLQFDADAAKAEAEAAKLANSMAAAGHEGAKIGNEGKKIGLEHSKIGVESAKLGVEHQKKILAAPLDPAELKAKKKPTKTILKMANRFLVTEGLVASDIETNDNEREAIRKSVDELDEDDRQLFRQFLAGRIQQVAESGE